MFNHVHQLHSHYIYSELLWGVLLYILHAWIGGTCRLCLLYSRTWQDHASFGVKVLVLWHLHIPHQIPLPSHASYRIFVTQDEKHDDEDFFQLLRHYHRQGAVLCCGGVQEAGQKQGLVQKHAFSLLQVRAVPLNWHSNEYFRMVPWSTQYIMMPHGMLFFLIFFLWFLVLRFLENCMKPVTCDYVLFNLCMFLLNVRSEVVLRSRYAILGELESGKVRGAMILPYGMLGFWKSMAGIW